MKLHAIAMAACAAVLVAAPAHAQSWGEVVTAQLDAVTEALGGDDITPTRRPLTGGLDAGETEDVTVSFSGRGTFLLVGVCDQDCSDLDLELYDPSGRLLDSDVADDDVPVLAVEISRPGNYRLRVKMITCSVEPCNYGVGVYSN